MKEKNVSIRTSAILFDKFRYAAKHEGRSASSQIVYMMRMYVNDFEKANGEILEEDINELFGKM